MRRAAVQAIAKYTVLQRSTPDDFLILKNRDK